MGTLLGLLEIIGFIMIFGGFLSIYFALPKKSLHPEVALLQVRYIFIASTLLMVFGLVLVILGLVFVT